MCERCEELYGMLDDAEGKIAELRSELDERRQGEAVLNALEAAGVDEWDGYDGAMESLKEQDDD